MPEFEFHPEGKVQSVTREPKGFRVKGYVDLDGAGNPMPPIPFSLLVKDSWFRRAFRGAKDGLGRFVAWLSGKKKSKKKGKGAS